ncbi:hypothetical protein ARTHRO9AX_10359 [Arthrobacter sp. 9AX]|nr:hypothetical protein ARTHRO9AX_10359 [Arthrobacter sp. 9AX]
MDPFALLAIPGKQKDAPRSLSASFAADWSVLLESVLDLLAGLLQIAFGLVCLALGPQALIARGGACRFLTLAAGLLCGVFNLVAQSHGVSSSGSAAVRIRLPT